MRPSICRDKAPLAPLRGRRVSGCPFLVSPTRSDLHPNPLPQGEGERQAGENMVVSYIERTFVCLLLYHPTVGILSLPPRSHKGAIMTQALARPAQFFDDKYGMDTTSLQRILGKTLGKQIDYADLYFQYEVSDAVSLEEGLVKQASKHVNQGVGVRAVAGEKTGYAFSDEITVSTLEIAAHTARQIASTGAEAGS